MSTTLHESWVKDAFANGQHYTAFGPQDKNIRRQGHPHSICLCWNVPGATTSCSHPVTARAYVTEEQEQHQVSRGPSEAVGPTTLRSSARGFPAESSGDIPSGLWSSEIWLLFLPSWVCLGTALSSHAVDLMSPNKHPGF